MSGSGAQGVVEGPADYWNRVIGPCYGFEAAAERLGVTRCRLRDLIDQFDVLSITTADGTRWIPVFQFGDDGQLLPHLRDAIERLRVALRRVEIEEADPWFVAQQLNARTPDWGGRTAAELLRTEHAAEVLWQLAWKRMPLDQRELTATQLEKAKRVAARVAELLVDAPVEIHLPTLYTTTGLPNPRGVVLVKTAGQLLVLSFTLDGIPEEIALTTAREVRAQLAVVPTPDGD